LLEHDPALRINDANVRKLRHARQLALRDRGVEVDDVDTPDGDPIVARGERSERGFERPAGFAPRGPEVEDRPLASDRHQGFVLAYRLVRLLGRALEMQQRTDADVDNERQIELRVDRVTVDARTHVDARGPVSTERNRRPWPYVQIRAAL